MLILYVAAVLLLLEGVSTEQHGHPPPPDHFPCYSCDSYYFKFPNCDSLPCQHKERCLMTNEHYIPGYLMIESRCVPDHDCHPDMMDSKCDLSKEQKCVRCCEGDHCQHLFDDLKRQHPGLAVTNPATARPFSTQTPTRTPTQSKNPYLNGQCADELVGTKCADTKDIVCKSTEGISLCAETCGLCPLLKQTFTANGTCQDQVVGDECRTHANICSSDVAEIACPASCNLCDTIYERLRQKVLLLHQSGYVPTATTPSPGTAEPCFDNHDNCASLTNVCSNVLAGEICRKFCNRCSSGTNSAGLVVG